MDISKHHCQIYSRFRILFTSLRYRWQTRATRCLTPTVLYTHTDSQCNKLVTDDRHQYITLTVHLSWQHLRRSTWQLYLRPFQRYGWCHQNINGSRDLTTPLSGMVWHLLASICYRQPAYQIWSLYLHSLQRYESRYKMSKMGWFG